MGEQVQETLGGGPAKPGGIQWIHRSGLLVWGLGLGGFSLFMGFAEMGEGWVNLFAHAMLTGVIVALALTAWLWPRMGGLLLAAAGAWGMWYFPHPFADYALALPALVLGLIGLISGK